MIFQRKKCGDLSPKNRKNCGGNFGGRLLSRIEKSPYKSIRCFFNVSPLDRTTLEIAGV
jgi:hypothetical protein